MRFLDFAWMGSVCVALSAAACGGSGESPGSGGGGAGTTTSTSSSTTTPTTTTPTTTTSSTGTGGDKGMPSDVYPAPHADPPEVVTSGGPVLKSPRIVPIFFANDDPSTVAALKDFAQKIGATEYWKATTAEYGIGPATAGPSVDLTEDAPVATTDNTIRAWLAGKLNTDDPAFPPADDNTVYVIHYPSSTTVSSVGGQSCIDYGGYHSSMKLDAAHQGLLVAYAVIPVCDGFAGLSGVDEITAVESHELVEASTDPYPVVTPAYGSPDDAHFYWALALGGGENADMCAQEDTSFTIFPELPYAVQRSWSNISAKAGHDPCVPTIPGDVYFNSVPDLNDDLEIFIQGKSVKMKGVYIPVGGTQTVAVRLFSDGDTGGAWTVDVEPWPYLGQLGTGTIDLKLDRNSGQNGEKLYLTITVYEENLFHLEVFRINSYANGVTRSWYGAIGN